MKTLFEDPEILEAIKELEKVSREKKTRDEYSRKEKALWDYVSFGKVNYSEGFNTGRKEIATNLLKEGVDRSVIRKTTNLTDKELDELKASLK